MNNPEIATSTVRHAGPKLGVVAVIFTILFKAGFLLAKTSMLRSVNSLAYA
ncbi:MAG: hypothetical protein WB696_32505 [Chthoniobacterales bacterium]|jgi:hypothetical protein